MSTIELLFQGAAARNRVQAEATAQLLLLLLAVASLASMVAGAWMFNPIAGLVAAGVAGLLIEHRLTAKQTPRGSR